MSDSGTALGARRLFARAAVVVAVSAATGAIVLAVTLAIVGVASEGQPLDVVPGRAWFSLVFLGPFIAVGLLVAGSLAAGLASAITVAPSVPRSIRSRRVVWSLAYAAATTACVLAAFAVTVASAPSLLGGVAVTAGLAYLVAWSTFALADRRVSA